MIGIKFELAEPSPTGRKHGLPTMLVRLQDQGREGRDMKSWRIIPVGYPEYSSEIKEYASKVALAAAMAKKGELVDVDPECIYRLGEKWASRFIYDYESLERRYGLNVKALFVLAGRMDQYCTVYEATLRQRAAELAGNAENRKADAQTEVACGTLLAQHYNAACKKELLDGMPARSFPGTSDILEAIALDRIMHASLCFDGDIPRALNLLADAMSAKFLYTQSDLKIESVISLKNDRKAMGKRGAEAKLKNDITQKDKKLVLECWNDWQKSKTTENPKGTYSSKAEFARDMLQKCNKVKSQPVIERWCTQWCKQHSAS